MEEIIVHGKAGAVDDFGYPIEGEPDQRVTVKTVQPLSLEELSDADKDGVTSAVRVWAPAGTTVKHDDDVTIRGLLYQVVATAWDWSKNRKPMLRRHKPSVVFDAVRGAGGES